MHALLSENTDDVCDYCYAVSLQNVILSYFMQFYVIRIRI